MQQIMFDYLKAGLKYIGTEYMSIWLMDPMDIGASKQTSTFSLIKLIHWGELMNDYMFVCVSCLMWRGLMQPNE